VRSKTLKRLQRHGKCELDRASSSCCSQQHPDYIPPKPIDEGPPPVDKCCSAENPICICGSKCGTAEELAATTCTPGPFGSCCDVVPIVNPPIDECCTAAAPACICGGSCGTRDEAAVTEDCAPGADGSCCDTPPAPIDEPSPPVAECCSTENPICICGNKCGTLEELARTTCVAGPDKSCCDTDPKPKPIEQCCTKDKPVCICGSFCGTRETLLTVKCLQGPPGACCSKDGLPTKL
jgi:hypothetical protein